MSSTNDTDNESATSFESIAIIDDAFNPPVFGKLDREIQDLFADPGHPETDAMIELMIASGILHEAEEGEISLEQLQSSSTLVKLFDLLAKENPKEAERFFSKQLADRRPLLDLRNRLEERGILASSISCLGPGEVSELGTLPDLVFLDLVLWEDLDESSLIEGVVELVRRLNPTTRSAPLFIVLMSERDYMLTKIADGLRERARLSINQFRHYPKQSLVKTGGLALPLLFETLQGLRGVVAAQARLAESLDTALHSCSEKVRALILGMEDGDFRYLAQQAMGDNVNDADYLV